MMPSKQARFLRGARERRESEQRCQQIFATAVLAPHLRLLPRVSPLRVWRVCLGLCGHKSW